MKELHFDAMRTVMKIVFAFALYVTVLAVFVPFSPNMPTGGLDPSWQYALNQALSQGLTFGKDITFTFGPYASVYTTLYHPATDHLTVAACLYLAILYASLLWSLCRASHYRCLAIFCAFLSVAMVPGGPSASPRDALLFSYPLLLAVLVFVRTLNDEGQTTQYSGWSKLFLMVLFTALGLLPLIKSTLSLICGIIAPLCFALLWTRKHKLLAIGSLFIPMVSAIFFWIVADQPTRGIFSFFLNTIPIISGYTEAMATSGNIMEVLLFSIASTAVLSLVAAQKVPFSSGLFLFLSLGIFLFVAFKAAFVRHDGHAMIAATAIIFAIVALEFATTHRLKQAVFVFCILTWVYIDEWHTATSTRTIVENMKRTYIGAFSGINMRVSQPDHFHRMFETSLAKIRSDMHIPLMEGTTDIYSYNQSSLLASGNKWSPRPVLQSYSAYNPTLAKMNLEHLTGEHAPTNIVFRVEPIDKRLPSLEDGQSWPVLLNLYTPRHITNDFLYLAHDTKTNTSPALTRITRNTARLGEDVALPVLQKGIFAEVDLHPTLANRVISIFYKPEPLEIVLTLTNGSSKRYRMVSQMGKAGFLISPLVENTADFLKLYSDISITDNKQVKSFRIVPSRFGALYWSPEYGVILSTAERVAKENSSGLVQSSLNDVSVSK
jgi:hypothetical protein